MLNKCMGLCRNIVFYSPLVLGPAPVQEEPSIMVIFGNEFETK